MLRSALFYNRYFLSLGCVLTLWLSTSTSAWCQPIGFYQDLEQGKQDYEQALAMMESQPVDSSLVASLLKLTEHIEGTIGYGADTLGRRLLLLADSLAMDHLLARIHQLLGRTYFRMGNYQASESHFLQCKVYRREHLDAYSRTKEDLALAIVFTYEGRYDEAVRRFIEIRQHYLDVDEIPHPNFYMQMGYFYHLQGEYSIALEMYEQAILQLTQSPKDERGRKIGLSEKGVTLVAMGQIQEGMALLREPLPDYQRYHVWRGAAYIYHHLADGFLKLGQLDSAAFYFYQSANINRVLNNHNMLAQTYLGLGKLHEAAQRPDSAYYWYQRSRNQAATPGVREATKEVLYALAQWHQDQNQPAQALTYFQEYDSLRTHILEASLNKMRKLAEEFSWQRWEDELTYQTQQARLYSRLSWAFGALGMLALGILGLLHNRYRLRSALAVRKHRQLALERQNAQLAKDKLQSELDHQQRALASTTLHAMQKNEVLTQVQAGLQALGETQPKVKSQLRQLHRQIEQGLQQDRDWDSFKLHFEQVHPAFFATLKNRYPHLNPNDLKHCAYLRINLSVKEVAQMIGINANSVTMSRYRLKKKLELAPEHNLNDFIQEV